MGQRSGSAGSAHPRSVQPACVPRQARAATLALAQPVPRTGITEAQMHEAVAALQARDDNVTKISVRKELGNTGSYGTIQSFLTRWREAQVPKGESAA